MLTDKDIRSYVSKGLLVKDMIDPEKQIQQCGIDLTAAKVFTMEGEGVLDFSNEKRKLPKYVEIPIQGDHWNLKPGVYHISMNETIILPKNIAALILPRSSALVCGIVEHTAVWDPGYEGRSFFHAEVSRPVRIYRNAKLGQMVFFRLDNETSGYAGQYKGEDLLKFARRGNDTEAQG